MRRWLRIPAAVGACLAAALGAAACDVGTSLDEVSCPPEGTSLTYENFGERFFLVHCVSCHGGANSYSGRSFTTVDAIRAQRERIFVNSALDNTAMPPGPDDPSEEEREDLAEWLACGAPE